MAAMTTAPKWIGQSVLRLEDPPLVRGCGRFAGDISFPHQLHMRVARSSYAHAKISSIDVTAARAVPGVVAVWTAADIADVPPIDFREGRIPAYEPYRQPVLASEQVRYVGEPVAAVFAHDPYTAEDAADLVTMEVDELPVLLAADAEPGEFSDGRNTEVAVFRQGYGDVDAVLRSAPVVVELELAIGRHSGEDDHICRLNGTMGQAVSRCRRESVHDLKSDAQNRICRHRTMLINPAIRSFTFQIFGNENEMFILDANIKDFNEINVIDLLRHPRALFESDAFHFINTGDGDKLHRNHSTAVVPNRFIGNDGAVARYFARRSIVVQTDRIIFGKHLSPPNPWFTAQLLFEQTRRSGRNHVKGFASRGRNG